AIRRANALQSVPPNLCEWDVDVAYGELTQNERTLALQSLRDGRARVCVATDVAARGIDLPSLDLVIHADLPNDPEVMQHRSGRTGRAGRKGTSVLLVPPARRRRAELLLNLSGTEAVWGLAPQADEIRKLDHERMKDVLFTEETTSDDLELAKALLAERPAEDIAAALARLYRARLPSPEDIIDPGEDRGRRENRNREDRAPRGDDRSDRPRAKPGKGSSKHVMAEPTVWFRAAIGRRKNAEARWLLPMICRRGGIDKRDIGAIKISDTTTEFEISERVAESFAAKVKRPDKEDSIRIEPMTGAPPAQGAEKPSRAPRRDEGEHDQIVRRSDDPWTMREPKHLDRPRGKPEGKHHGKPHAKPQEKPHDDGKFGKPAFGKKGKKSEKKFDKTFGNKSGDAKYAPSVTEWPGPPGKKNKKKRRG
ncbi:C-terminal helicase domain-containing protein, partial [Bradyrhizobium campsiandrae]